MLKETADKGVVLPPQVWGSVLGYEPQVFDALLQESKYSGWVGEYSQMLMNVNTANSGEAGRERTDDTELTDSGEMSREGLE